MRARKEGRGAIERGEGERVGRGGVREGKGEGRGKKEQKRENSKTILQGL